MKEYDIFTKVVAVIIACAVVLIAIIPNGIKYEFIIAAEIEVDPFYYPCDETLNSENTFNKAISLMGAGTYNITLDNVYLDLSSTEICAFYIADGINVNLTLVGENTLISGGDKAGIHVGYNSVLTIDGTGSLLVKGGNSDDKGGAGIGGSFGYANGIVKINGGNIVAEGGYHSAGIGGSNNPGGTIEINGGIIKANGGLGGAGIGGGYGSRGGEISINGGSITATTGSGAYDIGAGAYFTSVRGSTIITGGSVNNTTNTMYFGKSEPKVRFEVEVPGCSNTNVTGIDIGQYIYGIDDVRTDSKGLLYLWLPETIDGQDITVEVAGVVYTGALSAESKSVLTELKSDTVETEVTYEGVLTETTSGTEESTNNVTEKTEGTYETETIISNTETIYTIETSVEGTTAEIITSETETKLKESEVETSGIETTALDVETVNTAETAVEETTTLNVETANTIETTIEETETFEIETTALDVETVNTAETTLEESEVETSEIETTALDVETVNTTITTLKEIETTVSETTTALKEVVTTTKTTTKKIVTETGVITDITGKDSENPSETEVEKIIKIKSVLLNEDKTISDYEVKNVFDIVYIKQIFLYG